MYLYSIFFIGYILKPISKNMIRFYCRDYKFFSKINQLECFENDYESQLHSNVHFYNGLMRKSDDSKLFAYKVFLDI